MSKFIESEIIKELADLTYTMWSMGWDEKNGGNVSIILSEEQISQLESSQASQKVSLANIPTNLVGKYILITASGSNFRVLRNDLIHCTGVVKVTADGYEIVWGFADNNRPTSEIYMHLLSHSARVSVDPTHRVIVHNHATEISAMTFVHELDEQKLTRTLWGIITECVVVFPDGIGVLPWMVCGNEDIGVATAKKMLDCRIVIWAHHGILASGSSLEDALGLIETVNKAAKIYMMTYQKPLTTGITDSELWAVCEAFDLTPKSGYLK